MNWQQGYAPPNSDRKEGILRRKRLEYLDCVSQYYDIPDTERSDDEINMLRQVFLCLLNSHLDYYKSLLPNFDELLMTFLLDCRWLSTHCTWCLFLPRTTSSKILGAHPLYMVRYLFFCAGGFFMSSNMCIWGEGRNECTSHIKLYCTRLSLNYLSINLDYLINNFLTEFLLLIWITALLHFQR